MNNSEKTCLTCKNKNCFIVYGVPQEKKKDTEERRNLRSKTFPGFAKAIAEQWGDFLLNIKDEKGEKNENRN